MHLRSPAAKPIRLSRNRLLRTSNTTICCISNDYGTAGKKWPLVLFLHGAGERGKDLARVKVHGPPMLVEKGKRFPFILVSPQCPKEVWWDAEGLNALLDEIVAKYAVDEGRVYVTGLSMGGYGTWDLAIKYPDRFAAIAPICGGGTPYRAARKLKQMPIWVFHGGADPVVPIQNAQMMVEALKRAGATPRFTVYPGCGHDSWTQTYNNPAFYGWLLSQNRK